ncbi:MAG: PspC domain-containing protein [Alistipes sp.]|nr:PspC domain-containing protein [Alistipes sp.]
MNKKLHLSTTDKKLAGVCGGIAEYFNIDSLIVRSVFMVLALGGSLGIWAYLLVWLLAPKAN